MNNANLTVNRSGGFTFGNVISGTGSLTQQGAGTLILTGNNSYSGTTTISSGAIQIGASTTTGTLGSGDVINNGALNFDRSDDITVGNNISGSGELAQESVATLILTGTNTYTGVTKTFGGTLQVGNGGAAGTLGSGNVEMSFDSSLIFNRSDDLTVNNEITGSGSVTQQGTGILILTGNNTYDGGTTVAGGTLSLGSNTAAGTGAITTTGSVIDYADGVTIANPIVLNSEDTQLQVLAGSATQSGIISETGGARPLEKIGDGTLTLTGANTYTGGTTVREGTLTVSGAAAAISHSGADFRIGTSDGDQAMAIVEAGAQVVVHQTLVSRNTGEGTLIVTGAGTTWQNTGSLFRVGDSSGANSGALEVRDGAQVTADNFMDIAANADSTGSVLVDGTGSTLTTADSLNVGFFGSGTLTVQNGGLVVRGSDAQGVRVANNSDSTGILNLNSGGTVEALNISEGFGTGTVHFNGGRFRATATSTTFQGFEAGDIQLLANGAFFDTQAFALATSAILQGMGGVTKEGSGTLILSGANTYSGGTTISAGTLQIGDGGTTGLIGGNVTNNANLSFNRSNNLAFDGDISGSGSLTKLGAGVLTLTGANTYSGGTTISAGTLQIGGAGTAGSITGNVTNNAALRFNRSDDLTYAGDISGTGSVRKLGAGMLILTGASTYSGATTVQSGGLLVNGSLGNTELTVQNGALLGGSGNLGGNVTIQSGGILAPGNSPGILTIGGDLNLDAGSFTRMEINGTSPGTLHDQIVVGGTAFLDGTLELSFGTTPQNGDTFTLIDAAAIDGDFATVLNSLANALVFQTTITDDYILGITAVQTDFAAFAGTPNQRTVAAAIDELALTTEIGDLIDVLNSLPGSSLDEALDQVAPEELAALTGMTLANARSLQGLLGGRFRELRAGQQFSANGLSLWDPGRIWRESPHSLLAGVGGAPSGMALLEPENELPFGVFVSGQGVYGDFDGDSQADGFDFTTGGVIAGLDFRVGPHSTVGIRIVRLIHLS